MSGSDRNQRPPAKLATLAAVIVGLGSIGGGIAYGLVQQATYEQEAESEASDYAKHAAHKISQTCAIVAKAEKPLCLLKANEEYELEKRQNRHDASDLVAQRKSALWTGIMGVAALIGMALSAVGVVLVWTTFREQKRATNLAHEEAERARIEAADNASAAQEAFKLASANANAAAQMARATADALKSDRAWLLIKSVEKVTANKTFYDKVFIENGLGFRLVWKNHGKTPAINVRIMVVPSRWYKGQPEPLINRPIWPETFGSFVAPGDTVVGNPIILSDAETISFRTQNLVLKVRCIASYTDTISGEDHETDIHMTFEHMGGQAMVNGQYDEYIHYGHAGPTSVVT